MPKPLPNGPTEWPTANFMLPPNINALMGMMQPAFAAMAEFNGKLYDNAARFNSEWVQFLSRRLQEDFAVPQRLAACKSPHEAQQVCADYWQTALAQYQSEMGRLTKMSEAFAQQTATAVQKHAEAMAQEGRLAA